jgi:hypothetical protein
VKGQQKFYVQVEIEIYTGPAERITRDQVRECLSLELNNVDYVCLDTKVAHVCEVLD